MRSDESARIANAKAVAVAIPDLITSVIRVAPTNAFAYWVHVSCTCLTAEPNKTWLTVAVSISFCAIVAASSTILFTNARKCTIDAIIPWLALASGSTTRFLNACCRSLKYTKHITRFAAVVIEKPTKALTCQILRVACPMARAIRLCTEKLATFHNEWWFIDLGGVSDAFCLVPCRIVRPVDIILDINNCGSCGFVDVFVVENATPDNLFERERWIERWC
jgi:hypothetical protein